MERPIIESEPNATTQAVASASLEFLHDRLDALWMSYLRHLDAYTTAQMALQQFMRSGFYSLSRANFNARPGMRYGQDYFHERAVATRRVHINQNSVNETAHRLSLAVVPKAVVSAADEDSDERTKREAPHVGEKTQQPSPPATPSPEDDSKTSTNPPAEGSRGQEDDNDNSRTKEVPPKPRLEADPIRWYGIMVPRELRTAQGSFSAAMNLNVAAAVNAGRAMRETEVEIRKLRKEIRRAEKAMKR